MLSQALDLVNYTFNFHAVPLYIIALASLALGLMVLAHERFSRISFLFFLVTFTSGIWFFGFSWVYLSNQEDVALWWTRVAYIGVPFLGSAVYTFSVVVLGIYQRFKKVVWTSWIVSLLFLTAVFKTDALLDGMYLYWWGYYVRYGWLGAPFIAHFLLMFGASLYHFYGEYKISISGSLQKKRSREFLYAFGIGSLTTIVVPAKFGVPIYPIGFLPYLAFLVLSARAVWSHRLLEITPSIAANQIVDTMSDALLVLDLKGVVRLVNRAAIETFGYTEKEIMGKPAGFLFRDKLFTWNFEKLVNAGRIEGHEVSFDAKNGERFTLSLSASILKDQSGQAMAVVCSLRDISKLKVAESELQKNRERLEEMVDERTKELKEAKNTIVNILDDLNQSYKNLEEAHEELKEIDRLKTDIISNVSHELRTPITITKASLELLQEEKSKKGRLKLHSMANSAMHRLEAGINNLVSAADLQKERKLLHIENVDFKALVEEVVKVMERRNVTGQIQIHTSVPKDLPSVKGDRKKLQLVLWNLIENAVKFSRKSGDKVSVALCVEDSHVKIGVSDRGIGIPQDRLEIIFSPFYQIDTSSTRDYEGMGMGLAVAASIIKAHGGKIWAKSSPQRGSTFYFSLPAAKKQLKRSAVQL